MAGYREFQTGEVLTAANVNDFLMEQSVMKFADSSARDTALGTAVGGSNALREGMVAYLDDTNEVLKYDGTAWAIIGPAGIGSNVVSTVKTDTFSASVASGGLSGDVTGLTAAITPSSASAKVLVLASVAFGGDFNGQVTLYRDGSATSFVGDAASNRRSISAAQDGSIARGINTIAFQFLDSPATASEVTYSIRLSHQSSSTKTVYVNRSSDDTDTTGVPRAASSITAIEVAA